MKSRLLIVLVGISLGLAARWTVQAVKYFQGTDTAEEQLEEEPADPSAPGPELDDDDDDSSDSRNVT